MINNLYHRTKCINWALGGFFIGLMACTNQFKLDKSAVSLALPQEPVTVHGDKAGLKVSYEIAPKAFADKGVALFRIVEKDGSQTIERSRNVLHGSKVTGVKGNKIQSLEKYIGNIAFEIPASNQSKPSEYWLEVSSFSGSTANIRKSRPFLENQSYTPAPPKAHQFSIKIAEGPSYLANSGTIASSPKTIASNFVPDTIEPFEATIYFELNKSVIRESERKRKEILQLADFLSKTKEILKIEVNGYASPDGEIQFNNELADERATEAGKFVINALRSSQGLKDIQFDLNNSNLYVQNKGTEDWKGLLRGIEFARIPRKDEVRSIINNPNLNSSDKQSQLKEMRESWAIIAEDYLPPLRRANMIINTKVAPRTYEERMQLIRMKSPLISASEMLATAEQSTELMRRTEILEQTKALYPSDHRAYNNLAAMDIEAGRLETAARNLDAAAEAAAGSPEVLHNQAWVTYLQKDWSKLNLIIKRAQSNGQTVPEFEALMNIRSGQYAEAIKALSGKAQDPLLALAHCLNRDYSAATQALQGLNRQNPDILYLSAVVSARSKNSSALQRDLEALVSINPQAKSNLSTDPEFALIREENFFKNLIR